MAPAAGRRDSHHSAFRATRAIASNNCCATARALRSDNGPELIATAVLRWLSDEGIDTAHIAPGKPWQNGTDESFNGSYATSA